MTTLTRLRQQQDISVNDEESSTVQIANINESKQEEQHPDLYTPLSYDEADENQLAEFFTTLDIDISFGGCNSVINNISQVSESTGRQSAKRRRLSNDGDSLSSSFSDESYDYDGTGLQRKQDQVAPIE